MRLLPLLAAALLALPVPAMDALGEVQRILQADDAVRARGGWPYHREALPDGMDRLQDLLPRLSDRQVVQMAATLKLRSPLAVVRNLDGSGWSGPDELDRGWSVRALALMAVAERDPRWRTLDGHLVRWAMLPWTASATVARTQGVGHVPLQVPPITWPITVLEGPVLDLARRREAAARTLVARRLATVGRSGAEADEARALAWLLDPAGGPDDGVAAVLNRLAGTPAARYGLVLRTDIPDAILGRLGVPSPGLLRSGTGPSTAETRAQAVAVLAGGLGAGFDARATRIFADLGLAPGRMPDLERAALVGAALARTVIALPESATGVPPVVVALARVRSRMEAGAALDAAAAVWGDPAPATAAVALVAGALGWYGQVAGGGDPAWAGAVRAAGRGTLVDDGSPLAGAMLGAPDPLPRFRQGDFRDPLVVARYLDDPTVGSMLRITDCPLPHGRDGRGWRIWRTVLAEEVPEPAVAAMVMIAVEALREGPPPAMPSATGARATAIAAVAAAVGLRHAAARRERDRDPARIRELAAVVDAWLAGDPGGVEWRNRLVLWRGDLLRPHGLATVDPAELGAAVELLDRAADDRDASDLGRALRRDRILRAAVAVTDRLGRIPDADLVTIAGPLWPRLATAAVTATTNSVTVAAVTQYELQRLRLALRVDPAWAGNRLAGRDGLATHAAAIALVAVVDGAWAHRLFADAAEGGSLGIADQLWTPGLPPAGALQPWADGASPALRPWASLLAAAVHPRPPDWRQDGWHTWGGATGPKPGPTREALAVWWRRWGDSAPAEVKTEAGRLLSRDEAMRVQIQVPASPPTPPPSGTAGGF